MRIRCPVRTIVLMLVFGLHVHAATAGPPRALPPGQVPDDWRLQPPKDLDGYFPFDPPKSREQWAERSRCVRRQVRVALGLWPMPTETPLRPVVHGRIERDDHTVEKAYFESYPGFYVRGLKISK